MNHWTTSGFMRRACTDAKQWASGYADADEAWAACQRGDWMLWYAARAGADRRLLVRAACACARLALPHTSDPRVLAAIEVAESWARGEATRDQVRSAASAASADAADAAAACAAACATSASAASAATYAANAAYSASAANAASADATSARTGALAKCGDLVRQIIPPPSEGKA